MKPTTLARSISACQAARRTMLAVNVFDFDSLAALGANFAGAGRPVIAQFSSRFFRLHSPATVVGWRQCLGLPGLWLHLDHCEDPELFEECAAAGFDAVMFDGSAHPLTENIRRSRLAVRRARRRNPRVLVECEIGHVAGVEDGVGSDEPGAGLPKVEDVLRFHAAVQPQLLAVGFGNKHGHYLGGDFFDLALMRGVHRALPGVPLVLHGGSGMPMKVVRALVAGGHCKMNISTDLKVHWMQSLAAVASTCKSPLEAEAALRSGLDRFFAGLRRKYDSLLLR